MFLCEKMKNLVLEGLLMNLYFKTPSSYIYNVHLKGSPQCEVVSPHKSKQILFSVFRLCSDFCEKLLHIVEEHLNEWLPGIMRRYEHLIA